MSLIAAGVPKAPTGTAVERPERPMTANRVTGTVPMTAAGRPPGTASRNALQAPGTAFKRVGAAGGAVGRAAPQVEARPLTQQGMGGLKPTTQAAGRQVLDRSYFLSALRQRRQEILNVTHEMRVGATIRFLISGLCVIFHMLSCPQAAIFNS
jgi:intraflagellar transport protein 74